MEKKNIQEVFDWVKFVIMQHSSVFPISELHFIYDNNAHYLNDRLTKYDFEIKRIADFNPMLLNDMGMELSTAFAFFDFENKYCFYSLEDLMLFKSMTKKEVIEKIEADAIRY